MTIVDTTVWIDFLNGKGNPEVEWLDRELTRQQLGLTDLILCEVLQGVQDEAEAADTLRALRGFEIFSTAGVELSIAAAQNHSFLRGRGRTVRKTIDCLIATFCLIHDHSLIHRDRDYQPFEDLLGLHVIHA